MKDISIEVAKNYTLNARTAAIILHNNEILLSKKENVDYYSLPGGRIKIGEDSKGALIRELKEELNYDLIRGELKISRVIENFFNYGEDNLHEYLFIYIINLKDEYYNGNFTNLENPHMQMVWIPLEKFILLPVKPDAVKGLINDNDLKHLIIRENKKDANY